MIYVSMLDPSRRPFDVAAGVSALAAQMHLLVLRLCLL